MISYAERLCDDERSSFSKSDYQTSNGPSFELYDYAPCLVDQYVRGQLLLLRAPMDPLTRYNHGQD